MKALILDAGGVIFNEPMPDLLKDISSSGNASDLEAVYKQVYEDFWSGKLSKDDLWNMLISSSDSPLPAEHWEEKLLDSIDRGPVYFDLFYWAKETDLFIFSNHLSEWLRPFLSEIESFFQDVLISEEVGLAKPNRQAFEALLERLEAYDELLFVDDKEENILAARSLGIPSLLAQGPSWRDMIFSWLEN